MTAVEIRPAPAATAYVDDFHTWTRELRAGLRTGDLSSLDRASRVGEIEDSGGSQSADLVSILRVVLPDMLRFDRQSDTQPRNRAISTAKHRVDITDQLEDSPGLKSRLVEAAAKAYRVARLEAVGETGLPPTLFPEACPYTYQDIVDRPFTIDPAA